MDVRQAVPPVGSDAATPGASASALPTPEIGDWVVDLSAVVAMDAATVGGKAANLGELVGAGFPVPPGFVLPAPSYQQATEAARVRGRARRAPRPGAGRRRRSHRLGRAVCPDGRPDPKGCPAAGAGRGRAGGEWPPARQRLVSHCRAVVGRGGGRGGLFVRRHERLVHQRPRSRRGPPAGGGLLGLPRRPAGCRLPSRPRAHRLPSRPRAHRRAGDRGRRAGHGGRRPGRRCLHRRPRTGEPLCHHRRGHPRTGRGRLSAVPSSPTTTRSSPTVSGCAACASATSRTGWPRPRARRGRSGRAARPEPRRSARAERRSGGGGGSAGADGAPGLRACPRMSSGRCWRPPVAGQGPADHHAASGGGARRPAGRRAARGPGAGGRTRPRAAVTGRGRCPAAGGSAGRVDDQPGLAADDAPGRGRGHLQRRSDLHGRRARPAAGEAPGQLGRARRARSTSARVRLPPRPVPCSSARSSPALAASFRTCGDSTVAVARAPEVDVAAAARGQWPPLGRKWSRLRWQRRRRRRNRFVWRRDPTLVRGTTVEANGRTTCPYGNPFRPYRDRLRGGRGQSGWASSLPSAGAAGCDRRTDQARFTAVRVVGEPTVSS